MKTGTNYSTKLIDILLDIQFTAQDLPCGGIGPDGPSQKELNAATKEGKVIEDDPFFHSGQQIWLLAEQAIQLVKMSNRKPAKPIKSTLREKYGKTE